MAPARMIVSTATAAPIHLHSVPAVRKSRAAPTQMPAPASIAAATHFIFNSTPVRSGSDDARPTIRWQATEHESQARFPALREWAERIGEFWGHPKTRTFGELLFDLEEDKAARAVVFGWRQEMERPTNS